MENSETIKLIDEILFYYHADGNPEVWRDKILVIKERELDKLKLQEHELTEQTNPIVLPRYFVDERSGCAAVRDRLHPNYIPTYPGLHHDTVDVVEYKHGFQGKGQWCMKLEDIEELKNLCESFNYNHDNNKGRNPIN